MTSHLATKYDDDDDERLVFLDSGFPTEAWVIKASKDFKDRKKKELAWQDVARKTGFHSGHYFYLTSFVGLSLRAH